MSLCLVSRNCLRTEGYGGRLRLFKNCANPPSSNVPLVRHRMRIYRMETKNQTLTSPQSLHTNEKILAYIRLKKILTRRVQNIDSLVSFSIKNYEDLLCFQIL